MVPGTAAAAAAAKGTADRFRRVPANQAVDERFAADGFAGGEYAQRAVQDLAPTKGRAFTPREKGKKKRGSHRGGAIDAVWGLIQSSSMTRWALEHTIIAPSIINLDYDINAMQHLFNYFKCS